MHATLKQIDRKKKLIDQYRPLPKSLQKKLDNWLDIEFTYNSLALSGNTLTRKQVAQIINASKKSSKHYNRVLN